MINRLTNIYSCKFEYIFILILSALFLFPDIFCQTYRIDTLDGQTVQTCSGIFYDSGADVANYSDNENYTVTFCSTGKERITFDFSSFALRNEGGDTLKVYDGLDSSAPLLGTYTGEGFTFLVQSTDTCLTFIFSSDGSLTNSGWVATISCCPVPSTSSITGSNSECVGSAGAGYSVVNTPGSTYDWIITGGTQAGGGNSNSITVDWGDVPGPARVEVAENNGCTVGDTVSMDVTLWSLPAVSFTGLDPVYDINLDGPVSLTGIPPGGTFSGNGITGDQFDPASAGLGTHEIVYSYTDGNGCTNTDTSYTNVLDYDDRDGARLITDIDNWCSSDAAYSNSSATADMAAGSCWTGGTGNNVWFRFVATTGAVKVDVITGGSYGTMRGQQIAIWNAANAEVACNNSGDWFAGTLSLSTDTLTAGHEYWISVDDRRTHGTFTLCVDDTAGFDFKSGAVELTDLTNWCSADAAYENTYATPDESAGSCWTGGTGNNVWFRFTATTQAIKTDVITGGSSGTMRGQQIALWNAATTEIKCINAADWFAGTLSLSIDTLTIGHDYWISVDDRRTHGTFTLCLDNEVDYDYKSGALEITDINNYASVDAEFDNVYATPDESAGSCWTGGTDNNVWFKFVASEPTVRLSVITGGTKGTMRGQQIALWNEYGLEINCANAADWFAGTLTCEIDTLTLGRTYYISVDDRRTHGTFTLEIDDEVGYDFKSGALLVLDVDNWCSADAAYDNVYATADQSAGSCWTGGTDNNVWFKFVAISGEILIEVKTGGSYGTMRGQQIALWNAAGTEIGCINSADWYAGTLSLGSDTLTSGRTYYISVDDRRTHGTFALCVNNKAGFDFKSGAILIPPLNEWCSNDAAYDNTYATGDESAGSCWTGGTDNNVWFKFVAPTNAVTIDVTTGGTSGTMRGQQIALWTGSGTEVKCVNGADWYAGLLLLSIDTLTVGHTYYISVDDRRTHGTFTLCVDYEQNYDFKSGAYEITSIDNWCSSDAQFSNTYASADESPGSCWTGGTDNNVWFKFAATTVAVNIDVITGGSYGTMRGQQIALWNEEGTEVGCINGADWYAGTLSLSIDTLTPGHDYWISVDDRRTHGTFTLCVDDVVSNDYLSGALELVDLVNWCSSDAAYDNTYATPDESPGSCWTGGTDNNLWYKFTANTNSIKIDVKTGGTFGTMRGQQIALWNENGTEAGCINGADWYAGILSLSIDTLATGHIYYISVDDRRTHGTFTLCVTNTPDYDYKSGAYELTNLNNWQSSDARFSNTYATPDESAGSCWTGGTGNNVWFKFDAIFDTVTVDIITGGSYGTMRGQQIALWTSDGTEAGCVNGADWYAGTLSLQVDTLTPGHTYYISVDDRRTHGTFALAINNTSNIEYWAIADGDWNNPNTWSNTEGGAPAASYPEKQSIIHIKGYQVTVTGTEAAAIYLEVENDNTSLIIDADTLHVNGSVTFVNNGNNYDGTIIVQNTGGLDIDDDFIINRAGGANEFSVTVSDNSFITVGNELNILSSAGTSDNTELILDDNSSLTVSRDISFTHTGGQKILMQVNTSAVLTALQNISFSALAQDQVEIELNNNSVLSIAGDFERGIPAYGILDCNDNSTVVFGSSDYIQVIPQNAGSGTDDFTYQNITIDNSKITSPQLSLEGPVAVPGVLNLTDGVVLTSSSNLLTLNSGASTAGASSSSYIEGPLEKYGNTTFTFPVGKNGAYKPLSISAPSNITDAFSAEYFDENADPVYDINLKEVTIDHVSNCEYWIADRTAGTSDVAVTIGWDGTGCCINDLAQLKVAAWDGAQWINLGNGGTTGDLSAGTITSSSDIANNSNPLTFGDPFPIVDITGLAGPYCESDAPVALTGSPQDANGTFSGDGVSDNGNGTGSFNPLAAGDGIHTVTYTYLNPASGCAGVDTQNVTVYNIPTATLNGTTTMCEGSSTELSAFFTGLPSWTFKYTNTADTTEVTTSSNPYSFLVSDSGTYRIIEITDGKGCAGIDFGSSAIVGYYPEIPKPEIDTAGNIPFCDSDTLLLISSGGGLFSLWSNGETTDTINVTASGNYYVNIVDANYCLSESSDTVSVTVYRVPRKPSAISGQASLCQNSTNTSYTTYSQYASSYLWELFPGTAGIISGNGTTGTVDWDAAFNGTARIVVKGNNPDCGSGVPSDTLNITVSPYPGQAAAPTGPDTLLINSSDTDYNTSGAADATSYIWSISPPGAGSISGTGTTGTVDWNDTWTGTASITVRGVNACGSGNWSDALNVEVIENPELSFSGPAQSGLESVSPVQFIVYLSTPSPFDISFNYTTADGTAVNGSGNDYETASGSSVIPAGETIDTLSVTVYEDGSEEPNETFTLTLYGFVNAIAGTDTVITYTIMDNDGLGWVGPGGVGNLSDQINVWHNTYYSDNLSDGEKVSVSPNQWDDLSVNNVDAYQDNASVQPTFYNISPVWNERPIIRFNSASNEYLKINDNQWMNTAPGAQTKRTIIVAFRPGTDISSRQVVFEEGATVRGLNIYIENDSLYIGGWNDNNDDGGQTTPWLYTSVKSEISANTPYFAIIQFDFDDILMTGEVRGSLNGVDLGALPGAGKLFPHSGNIGVGAMYDGACWEDGSCSGGNGNYFDGYIAEFISGNIVYNQATLKIVHNYLAAKYGISLPVSEDLYDYESSYGYELIGIGQVDASNYHNSAQGQGIIRIQNPGNIGDDKFLFTGHDNGDISAWVNTDVPNNDTNIMRITREWRVDKQGGDIGTIDMIVDSSSFGSYYSSYSAFALLIDSDGDFTSGSRSIQLESAGSGYFQATAVDFSKGDYFTIARIRPVIEFMLSESDADEDVSTVDISIRMNYAPNSGVSVDYQSANGTADKDQVPVGDYNELAGTFNLPAGDTSGVITLTINNDAAVESDETLTISLFNPSSGINLGGNTVHTFTIHDDDNGRKVQFTSQSDSGDESVTPVLIGLHLTENNPTNPVDVDYDILAGSTAENGGVDYTLAASGTVTFGIGDTLESLSVDINDDAISENTETIIIEISNPSNANLGDTTIYTYSITDNDPEPEVYFSTTSTSGSESYSPIQVVIKLSAASGKDIQVDRTITGGSALPGGIDYTFGEGTATIPAGEDSIILLLDIFNDIAEESNEDLEITLSNPVNAALGDDSVYTHLIIDDDGLGWLGPGGVGNFDNQITCWLRTTTAPGLSDGESVSTDPDNWKDQTGKGNHAFQSVSSNQPTFWDISPTWNNRPVIEFDRAGSTFLDIADNPYMNTASGAQTKRTIIVAFRPANNISDRQVIFEEGASVRGLNLYIEEDSLFIGGWNENNDDGGLTTPWPYTYVSSEISTNTPYFAILQFDFDDLLGTGEVRGSLNGIDLGQLPGAGKLFAHSGDIGIGGQSDGACYKGGSCQGGDNNFFDGYFAELVSGNIVFNTAQMKIVHNYLAAKYNINLPGGDDIYDYQTNHGYELFGIGQENTANSHYIAQGSGIIRIENPSAAGDGKYLMIGHNGADIDDWKEYDEIDVPNDDPNIQRVERVWRVDKQGGNIGTIKVRLDTLDLPVKSFGYTKYVLIIDNNDDFTSGARTIELVHDGQQYHSVANINFTKGAYFTIGIINPAVEFLETASNDQEPVTSIDPMQPEFVVRLNYEASADVTVDYTTSDGSALAGSDYFAESSSVTISAGDTSSTFNISIINDTDIEPDENFQITLSNPTAGMQIGSNSVHTFTINDDDNPRKVQFTVSTGSGDEAITPVTVEVSINIQDAFNYTKFDYTVTGGTATEGAGNDFVLANGTDSIAPGTTTVNLPAITINDDLMNENDETFIITLSNPVNANLGTNTTYTYTIQDNDAEPTVTFASATGAGAESFNPAYLLVRLSAVSEKAISIDYSATDITAVGGGIDYNLPAGTLNIPAGVDSVNITADIFNDLIDEPSETFSVTLSNPSNATLGAITTLTYTIYDDDGLGYIGPGGVGDETQYKAWYKVDEETAYSDNDFVNILNDISGNSNDAVSTNNNYRPTYQSDVGNTVNGRPVVLYDGSNDFLNIANSADFNTSSYTLKTIVITFRTGADVTSRQVIYEQGGGSNGLNIYIDNGNLYFGVWAITYGWGFVSVNSAVSANTVYYALFELDIPNQTLTGYVNGSLIGQVATGTEELGSHTGQIGLGAKYNATYYHDGSSSGNGHYFTGSVLEFTYYNYITNSADKKLIENYLAAKYRDNIEATMINDLYDYRATHDNEVFGIGQDDSDNNRIISQGSGIVRIDNPSSMDDGDYLVIGHDNNNISSWTATGVPYDSVQRIERLWIADETGNVGNVRIGIDTTVLPAKPAMYECYIILVDENNDADFDMSTNPQDVSMHPMNSKSGALRLVSSINLDEGDIFTVAVARNRTIKNGNWNDNSTWLLNMVPGAGETALITDGDTIDLASDVTVGGVVIGNTSVLNLNSYEFTLTNVTFENNGTLNIGTSTFNYGGVIDQDVQPLAYHNLTISGSGTKTLAGDITIAGNLLILGPPALTLDVDAAFDYSIEITGNWQNTSVFTPQNGTVTFAGTNQSINRTAGAEVFHDLVIQTSGTLTLVSNVTVSNEITMDGGNISTGTHRLTIGTGAGNPGTLTRNSGYIIGNLERWVTNNNAYEFPIGTSSFYRPASVQFSNVTAGGSLQIGFNASNPGSNGLPLSESGLYAVNTFIEGYWTIDELNAIAYTGGYDVDLTANGFTSYSIGAGTRVITRPNGLTDWSLSGTHVNAVGNTVQRNSVTVLPSHLAVADTSMCNLSANLSSNDITCNGANDGTITISSPSGGSGVYEYTVNGGSGWQSGGSFTGLAPDTYDVRIRDANNISCELVLNANLVLTEPPPVVPTITGPVDACVGVIGNLYETEAGMSNYSWNVSAGGTITAGGGINDDDITVTWDVAGAQTVDVNYDDANGCSAATPTVYNVDVHDLPVPGISGTDTLCHGSTETYITEAGMSNYDWEVSAGGTISDGGDGNDFITITWDNGIEAQSVSVAYENVNGCTAASPTVLDIWINKLPDTGPGYHIENEFNP